jgi:hypothetical protein
MNNSVNKIRKTIPFIKSSKIKNKIPRSKPNQAGKGHKQWKL